MSFDNGVAMKNLIINGVTVYTDRYAIQRDSNTVYFLSVCGHTQAVNSVLAAVASHDTARVQFRGDPVPKLNTEFEPERSDYVNVSRNYGSRAKILSRPVSWGRAHGLFYDASCNLREANGFFVAIGSTMAEVEEKVYRVLDSKPIPLVPEWQEWLITTLRCENIMEPLLTHGCEAVIVEYEEERILELIREGISGGAIFVGKRSDKRMISEETDPLRLVA